MWRGSAELVKRWTTRPSPLWIAVLLLWLWVTLPLVAGDRSLFYRDVLWTHAHFKAFGAEELHAGRIPAFNSTWALGQPFRGNPNTLAFYPGNLLYLVLPFASAFHLHYMLHWLLALGTMWLLARQLGQGRTAALCAGLTYAGSGWMMSALTFYNILTVSAWWPLVLWGMVRGDRRGLAIGGVACGLACLGGEPVTLAIGLAPLVLVAGYRHGVRAGIVRTAVLGTLAVLVAAPQIVATLRVLDFTFRGGHGLPAIDVDAYSLHPLRLLELLVPFPFGSPAIAGPEGFWTSAFLPRVPYVLTLHFGIVGLALAAASGRRRPRWAALALSGLLVAWLGGVFGESLMAASGGLFRSAEKFLFWFALAVPLLAGWGVDRLGAGHRPASRGRKLLVVVALAMLALGVLSLVLTPAFVDAVAGSLEASELSPERRAGALAGVEAHAGDWTRALATGGMLLALLAWTARRGWREGAVALQLLALIALAPLVMTAGRDLLTDPGPLGGELPAGTGVVSAASLNPAWEEVEFELSGPWSRVTRAWIDSLASPVGVLHGLSFPMGRDLEGMHSPLFSLMSINLGRDDWPVRIAWCRALGAGALVTSRPLEAPDLTLLSVIDLHGSPHRLYRVRDPAPAAWWPVETVAAANPVDAFRQVSGMADPVASVVTGRTVEHQAGASVRLLEENSDRLEIEVVGEGGVLAVRRAYQPLWQARSGGERLAILPINLNLLGVEVPAGTHRVVLDVAWWPEAVAGVVSFLALVTAAAVAFSRRLR